MDFFGRSRILWDPGSHFPQTLQLWRGDQSIGDYLSLWPVKGRMSRWGSVRNEFLWSKGKLVFLHPLCISETMNPQTNHLQCEAAEGLWLEGKAAFQTHSFRDPDSRPLIPKKYKHSPVDITPNMKHCQV